MRVGLVLRGEEPTADELQLLDRCDRVVCADGAAGWLLDAGRVPDLIVGDLDSLGEARAREAEARGSRLERLPSVKDETDGERALESALALGATELMILGGHGGRSAMFLANLGLLQRCHERGVSASMRGGGESVRLVGAGEVLEVDAEGSTLNLLPWGGDAVVSIRGASFEASRLPLTHGSARGTSNRVLRGGARVEVHEGRALVILEDPG